MRETMPFMGRPRERPRSSCSRDTEKDGGYHGCHVAGPRKDGGMIIGMKQLVGAFHGLRHVARVNNEGL